MNRNRLLALAASAALFAAALPAAAQSTDETRRLLRAAVVNQLVQIMPNGPGHIIERLAEVKTEPGLGSKFDPSKVALALFPRTATIVAAADCRATLTPQGEADEIPCIFEAGRRDDPRAAYTTLQFSKYPGLGDITFVRRAAFDPAAELTPRSVKLTDADAYERATKFLQSLGIPASEIPKPPPGAKNPLPVRTLAVGAQNEPGQAGTRHEIQKVVAVRRAFATPELARDPTGGIPLNHVLAPGFALVVVDDGGVQAASIEGWSDAQVERRLSARNAKSLEGLADEITDDLYNEGVRRVGTLSILVALRKAYPNPEDDCCTCPACGLLLPAVQVAVSSVPAGPVQPGTLAPAGVVRTYDLATPAGERAIAR